MNASVVNSFTCPYVEAIRIFQNYLIPLIAGIGILTNSLCILVFSAIVRAETSSNSGANGHMFKYLLCKAAHDDVNFIVSIFSALYYCTSCASFGTYAAQIWYIWFYWYLTYINSVCSALLEVAATLDCLLTINRRLGSCRRTACFWLVVLGTLAYTAAFYSFKIFEFNIGKYPKSTTDATTNETEKSYNYFYEYNSFRDSEVNKALKVVHGVTRDVIALVVIVVLNGLILASLNEKMARKKRLLGRLEMSQASTSASAPSSSFSSSQAARADRAASKATTMVIMSGVNYVMGHGLMLVYYCFLVNPSVVKSCIFELALSFMFLSFATPFFIYYAFNKTFRAKFSQIFRRQTCITNKN